MTKLLFWPILRTSELVFIYQEVISNLGQPQILILHLFQKLICQVFNFYIFIFLIYSFFFLKKSDICHHFICNDT